MQRRRYRILPPLLIFGALLAVLMVAPAAVGATELSVSSGTTANGQAGLVLSGNGFGPGEKITLTGLKADNTTVSYPDAVGNPIGAFQVTIPSNSAVFRIKASGQLTGITTFADVGPVAGTPPGFVPPYPRLSPCSYFDTGYFYNSCPFGYGYGYGFGPGYGVAPGYGLVPGYGPGVIPPNGVVPVQQPGTGTATVGTPITIVLGGFAPNESVSASITAPDASVTQIGSAAASTDGTVSITATFPSAGNWQVTAHGQTSQHDAVNRYNVT